MSTNSNADSKVIWMDGKLVPYADARVHVLSHSLHYGTAAFEGIRAYKTHNGKAGVFRIEDHFRRFFDSIHVLGYVSPYTLSDYVTATHECIKANELVECYIRPLGYLDDSNRGLKLPDNPEIRTAIAVWPWGKYMGEAATVGIRVMVSTLRRADVASSLPWAKLSGGYLASVLARREATKNKLDEAILLDPQGFVAEGSGENIFVVKDGILYTPPSGFILPGLTRDSVFQIAQHLGYEVREELISRNRLYLADEVFFTGTAVEITPIREIDYRPIGAGKPGPITKAISEVFFKSVRGEVPQFHHWVSEVD